MEEVITITTVLTAVGGQIVVPFVNKIIGPAADEFGLILSDKVRMYRLEKQIKLFASAQKLLAKAGIEPKQVSLKTLLPLMEHASLEEDPRLSDKWAALLANAADSTSRLEVKPIFADILKSMTVSEAKLLDVLFKNATSLKANGNKNSQTSFSISSFTKVLVRNSVIRIDDINEALSTSEWEWESDIDSLMRNRLIIHNPTPTHGPVLENDYLFFTSLGYDFMIACSPPTSIS